MDLGKVIWDLKTIPSFMGFILWTMPKCLANFELRAHPVVELTSSRQAVGATRCGPWSARVMWIPTRSLEYFWLLTWNRLKRRWNFADPTFSPGKPRFSLFAVRICSWISSTVMGWSTIDWWWMVMENRMAQGDGLKAAGMKDNDLTLGDWEC